MHTRPYDPDRDLDAATRVWHECGWLDGASESDNEALALFLAAGPAFVAELEGAVECVVGTLPAQMRYLDGDLPVSGVSCVVTSRVARKRGLASRLTAEAVAAAAADGAALSWLGIFDQGYYDQLGYGTGPYECFVHFDPAQLRVDLRPRIPRRLSASDWEQVHRSRLARRRHHGGCNVLPPAITRAEMIWNKKSFGLGYFDPDGALGHHLWLSAEEMEVGPYRVEWMSYRSGAELMELLALIRSLGDQVRLVRLTEPPGMRLQDLLHTPLRTRWITKGSRWASTIDALACWQMRICDLNACIERLRLPGDALRFNLRLDDPIERLLADDAPWRGIAGNHVATFGPHSQIERGSDDSLPTLHAHANAFTQLWLGARSPTSLAAIGALQAPAELVERLEHLLRLPVPCCDWDF